MHNASWPSSLPVYLTTLHFRLVAYGLCSQFSKMDVGGSSMMVHNCPGIASNYIRCRVIDRINNRRGINAYSFVPVHETPYHLDYPSVDLGWCDSGWCVVSFWARKVCE